MYTMPTENTNETMNAVAFDAKDKKGRAMGANITRSEVEFIARAEDATCGYTRAPGAYKALLVHTTRDGVPYGASQREKYFGTDAEREAEVKRYLAYARKAAQRKA